jgi:hypothetical protein
MRVRRVFTAMPNDPAPLGVTTVGNNAVMAHVPGARIVTIVCCM